MPGQRASRVIVDTNLWISFLIGKELHQLKDLIVNERIKLVTCDQLINEMAINSLYTQQYDSSAIPCLRAAMPDYGMQACDQTLKNKN